MNPPSKNFIQHPAAPAVLPSTSIVGAHPLYGAGYAHPYTYPYPYAAPTVTAAPAVVTSVTRSIAVCCFFPLIFFFFQRILFAHSWCLAFVPIVFAAHCLPCGLPCSIPHGVPCSLPHGVPYGVPGSLPHGVPDSVPCGYGFRTDRHLGDTPHLSSFFPFPFFFQLEKNNRPAVHTVSCLLPLQVSPPHNIAFAVCGSLLCMAATMVAILMVATVAGMAIPTHMAVATTTYVALCAALLFFFMSYTSPPCLSPCSIWLILYVSFSSVNNGISIRIWLWQCVPYGPSTQSPVRSGHFSVPHW